MPDPLTTQEMSLDEYMEATKDLGYPASIRRIAWLVKEPPHKVFDQFMAAKENRAEG